VRPEKVHRCRRACRRIIESRQQPRRRPDIVGWSIIVVNATRAGETSNFHETRETDRKGESKAHAIREKIRGSRGTLNRADGPETFSQPLFPRTGRADQPSRTRFQANPLRIRLRHFVEDGARRSIDNRDTSCAYARTLKRPRINDRGDKMRR